MNNLALKFLHLTSFYIENSKQLHRLFLMSKYLSIEKKSKKGAVHSCLCLKKQWMH